MHTILKHFKAPERQNSTYFHVGSVKTGANCKQEVISELDWCDQYRLVAIYRNTANMPCRLSVVWSDGRRQIDSSFAFLPIFTSFGEK